MSVLALILACFDSIRFAHHQQQLELRARPLSGTTSQWRRALRHSTVENKTDADLLLNPFSTRSTIVDKIKLIEDEMASTQKNKAPRSISANSRPSSPSSKRELLTPTTGGGGGGGVGFDVARTGIASVGFVGFPSVGKSSLMSGLTGTESIAADYEFHNLDHVRSSNRHLYMPRYLWLNLTLWIYSNSVPGTLQVHGAPIQILDLPGIIEGAKDGKGRVARTCNLIFIVLDVLKPLGDKAIIENELEGFGIRLGKKPPAITVKKKEKGGIAISNTVPLTHIDADEIKAVLAEYKMSNADVALRCDPTLDEFIDVVEGGRVYIPVVYVLNKIDAISIEELDLLYKIPNSVPISARESEFPTMWEKLDLVRIYTKPKGKQPDYSSPVVLKRARCSVEGRYSDDGSIRISATRSTRIFSKQLKYAMVYGSSVKHSRGQRCGWTISLQ
ncbi:BQ2448_6434 [Microbotryum intermedium]|uniref:BQ2448_6434 protein n=1 Tax=Microbotryum intermedium TaxID=269621 RepID=A0A238FJP1_9BASI|nr:BQ2448_6434 [Microbotryum intermedium]